MVVRIPWRESNQRAARRRWLSAVLLAIGIAALGYVGYALADAWLFQKYEHARFDAALSIPKPAPAAVSSFKLEIAPRPGAPLGRLEIPALGLNVMVLEGTDDRTLRRAAGHISGTALPAAEGNVAIAGHRDTFFRSLENIRPNDVIELTTLDGYYRYRVQSTRVVGPDDVGVLADSGSSVLTLVTCFPFHYVGPAPKRFIVRANQTAE